MNPAGKPSAGSDEDQRYANVDEKKRRRMIQNRNSARRCRLKRLQYLEELAGQVAELQAANAEVTRKINAAAEMSAAVESENNVLRAQSAELADKLRSLDSLLVMIKEFDDVEFDNTPEIPDASAEPWQLPSPGTWINSASDAFHLRDSEKGW